MKYFFLLQDEVHLIELINWITFKHLTIIFA